ncbi:MAG: GGDEF domain-containing protein [Bacillota bacterium]
MEKSVQVSIGLTNILPDQESTTDEILKKADQALYQAKTHGKSRIEIKL